MGRHGAVGTRGISGVSSPVLTVRSYASFSITRVYARLDLNLQKQFASKYALALWNYVRITWEQAGSMKTPFIELDTYRALMGIKEGGYP